MSNVQFLIEAEHNLLSVGADLLPAEARLVRAGADLTLTQAYQYAAWRAAQLDAQWQECSCASCDGGAEDAECPLYPATLEADRLRDEARAAWLASDEPRAWRVADDQASWMVEGLAPSDIEERLEDEAAQYDRDDPREPMLYSLDAAPIDPVTGEADRREGMGVSGCLDGEEPDCVDGEEHDWCSPLSVLGGLRENPGVWGRGAGIVSRYVCGNCGAYQVHETARQDPCTGTYHAATSYEDADDASETWAASRRRKARTAALVSALEDEHEENALRAAVDAALDEDEDATADDVRLLLADAAMIEACPYTLTESGPRRYTASVEVDANDDEACDAILAEVREAIGPGWRVEWTGCGNGNESDFSIEWEVAS